MLDTKPEPPGKAASSQSTIQIRRVKGPWDHLLDCWAYLRSGKWVPKGRNVAKTTTASLPAILGLMFAPISALLSGGIGLGFSIVWSVIATQIYDSESGEKKFRLTFKDPQGNDQYVDVPQEMYQNKIFPLIASFEKQDKKKHQKKSRQTPTGEQDKSMLVDEGDEIQELRLTQDRLTAFMALLDSAAERAQTSSGEWSEADFSAALDEALTERLAAQESQERQTTGAGLPFHQLKSPYDVAQAAPGRMGKPLLHQYHAQHGSRAPTNPPAPSESALAAILATDNKVQAAEAMEALLTQTVRDNRLLLATITSAAQMREIDTAGDDHFQMLAASNRSPRM